MPVPLDEYPIHQVPLSMRYTETSDRNFYDRCYFNAHGRKGDLFLITGLGVYPNVGVIDAYALVRRGDRHYSVRMSDALEDRSLDARVGPYRVEVLDPLRRIRLVCDTAERGLGFDLTWEGSFPCIDEPRHINRSGNRVMLDGCRFAQVGTWEGTIHLDGEDIAVEPDTWVGSRDRSWGIRPTGEPEPPGRAAEEPREGFWWLYVPLRFDDYALIVIVQEDPDGTRTLNAASRVWADGRHEQLGWPELDFTYRSGTRIPERLVMHMRTPDRRPLEVEVESLLPVPLHIGAGYGADPDWSHGVWKGRDWIDSAVYDLTDPAVAGRIPFGVIDHVGRAVCDGAEGWGLFEHASVGRHDPTGFKDFMSVAP
ncbi:MAG TPA: hypothetical protein VFH58_05960 [Acidimicrobiales bacterium]|nr:hypothetical protein [Acidimicrobiales bacterium]